MLNIYICEDNKEQKEFLTDVVEKIVLMENYDLKFVLATENPYELLEVISENEVGIYFLDIDLGSDITGLALAQKIRKVDKRGFIIFVTTHSEMAYMTFSYKVEAMDFITKGNPDVIKDRVKQCVDDAYRRYCSPQNTDSKIFKFNIGDKEYCIGMQDIMFIETSDVPHKLVLHAKDSILEFQGSLKSVISLLDEDFVMIHRSFIVNKKYIHKINIKEKTVVMNDDSVCFASAKKIKELIKQ